MFHNRDGERAHAVQQFAAAKILIYALKVAGLSGVQETIKIVLTTAASPSAYDTPRRKGSMLTKQSPSQGFAQYSIIYSDGTFTHKGSLQNISQASRESVEIATEKFIA